MIRCATIAQPQGGPRDSLPPIVISTVPPEGTTNFQSKRITINFNEYVAIKDQQKEVITSPPFLKKPTLTLKGRSIEVDFQEPLDSNTTYRIDFGNAIVDNNEGNRLGYYNYKFSTGPMIDSLLMSGLLIDAQTRDSLVGGLVFFFDARVDTLPDRDSTLFNARADVIVRTDSSGLFLADILKDKPYRAYAIIDKNGNHKYESGTDMVAMLDSSYNPADMPDFDMWIAPGLFGRGPRRHIDPPQLLFEAFLEEPKRKQTLTKQERPDRQKILLTFNTFDAQVTSVKINGIDSSWVMLERGIKGDSVWAWIVPPTKSDAEALGDTLRGTVTYLRADSLWQLHPFTEDLLVTHRLNIPKETKRTLAADSIRRAKILAKRQRKFDKRLKKQLKTARKTSRKRGDPYRPDSVLLLDSTLFLQVHPDSTKLKAEELPNEKSKKQTELNPFGYKVKAENPLNPEQHIRFTFDYPLKEIDSDRITLEEVTRPKIEASSDGTKNPDLLDPVTFTVDLDSTSTRKELTVKADWQGDKSYRLTIPEGTFTNIAYQTNDTLISNFTVALPEKYGTLILKTAEDSTLASHYILEVLDSERKAIRRIKSVKPGESYTIRYLTPGKYKLRIIEDRNNNGRWDTGSLVERRRAESVRVWKRDETDAQILAKENWDVEVPINLKEIFQKP